MPYENTYNIDDHKLIQLVRERPELWNPLVPKYSDPLPKNKIWKDIGQLLGVDPSLCKNRWVNIRDNYRRALKKSLMTEGPCVYKLDKELDFVKSTIIERQHKFAKLMLLTGNNENATDDPIESPEPSNIPSTSSSSNTNTATKKRKTMAASRQIQIESWSARKRRYSQEDVQAKNEAIDAFLAGLAPTLKNLSPYYLNLAKTKIFMIVQKYEMEMLLRARKEIPIFDFNNDDLIDHENDDNSQTAGDILDFEESEIDAKPFIQVHKNNSDSDDE